MTWKLAVRNILGLLAVPGAYVKYLRGYDVVYFNSSALCFYGLMVKIFSPKTRVIYHVREPLLNNGWGAVIRAALRRSADYVIAISKNEMANLRVPDVPGEVAYNYVHSNEYPPQRGNSLHRRDSKVQADNFVVGYFARVDIKNGINDFLEIARRFEEDSTVAFCIYGHTGHETGQVQELIVSAGPNVHVYPMVFDVPENLGDLDLLLVPFRAPHFSRSVIEAAMLGVPSIIYDIVSVNETVKDGETGFVVPLGDVAAMGDRLAQLKANPELQARLSANARKFAIENFSERNYRQIRDAIHAQTSAQT
ncbi:glycosyltransferase family 4 protein [Salipiger marinus]|uniref:glycosyltransferase family 4 protein n=1 Tax=Salipiger marinus TaxID=555512 RepID=UPI002C7AEE4D|nr:glycosyltransferase family 4 protein [Salipiger manganoxidans]MEB3421674.1 glycosyltransferase family 4 protein [Salipiger manganoxidans]